MVSSFLDGGGLMPIAHDPSMEFNHVKTVSKEATFCATIAAVADRLNALPIRDSRNASPVPERVCGRQGTV